MSIIDSPICKVTDTEPTNDTGPLFVYGSLMRGLQSRAHHQLMQQATYLGKGYFPGRLYEVDKYPGAIRDENSKIQVRGELYLVSSPELMYALDTYEECTSDHALPHEYCRVQVDILRDNAEPLQAWTYLYLLPTDGLVEIPSGDYKHWMQRDSHLK